MAFPFKSIGLACGIWTLAIASSVLVSAQQPTDDGPQYAEANVIRPANYREWTYVSSGLGMAYGPAVAPGRPPRFTNVFVNPRSYREFMQTGKWPDRTMFILEIREAASKGSINQGGNYQGRLLAMEAEVKDSRAPGGWAFFNFEEGGTAATGTRLPQTASCYACHKANTAVENTFVQFYPELMAVARAKGTVNAGYRENAEAAPAQ